MLDWYEQSFLQDFLSFFVESMVYYYGILRILVNKVKHVLIFSFDINGNENVEIMACPPKDNEFKHGIWDIQVISLIYVRVLIS